MRTYDHVEALGNDEVEGILDGLVYVFPKIDGTNARVMLDEGGELVCGSKNRILALDADNQGFMEWCTTEGRIALRNALSALEAVHEPVCLHGEWLVPHTLKTYRDDAWREFYVFDVFSYNQQSYLPYDAYLDPLLRFGIHAVPCMAVLEHPTVEKLLPFLDKNTFLIKDGEGVGEGIVLKNYDWRNRFGRQPWAKIVRNEFKDTHRLNSAPPTIRTPSEAAIAIANRCVTQTLVDKELSRIKSDNPDASERTLIPRLLSTVFHCVVTEELWNALKKEGWPTVDFKRLRRLVEFRVKELKPGLFGRIK